MTEALPVSTGGDQVNTMLVALLVHDKPVGAFGAYNIMTAVGDVNAGLVLVRNTVIPVPSLGTESLWR